MHSRDRKKSSVPESRDGGGPGQCRGRVLCISASSSSITSLASYHSALVLEFLGGRESAQFVLGPVPHSLGKGARGALVDRPIKTVCNRGGGPGKNDSPKEECVVTPPPQKGHRCCVGWNNRFPLLGDNE